MGLNDLVNQANNLSLTVDDLGKIGFHVHADTNGKFSVRYGVRPIILRRIADDKVASRIAEAFNLAATNLRREFAEETRQIVDKYQMNAFPAPEASTIPE